MADQEVFVHVDLGGDPILVGRLWPRLRRGRESATFEYDATWLSHPERFSLEPALQLGPGPQHTSQDQPLFGALGDSAPDRWGRALMRRGERQRALREGRRIQTLGEVDYLLMVDDEARQGALRFAFEPGGTFLASATSSRIPPLIELPRLLAAGEHAATETETEEELSLLLGPGSSLGGARPKAVVRDSDGQLTIAKFPKPGDEYDVGKWEAVALLLAANAGIDVPAWRLEQISGKTVLLLRRFDRSRTRRIPFLSAMTMLDARDHDPRSYLDVVDALRINGASFRQDAEQLWRRVVFSVLISNTDDHLRNHGFLYQGGAGWSLSPAYDMNPVPLDLKPRMLTTAIIPEDATASLELALEYGAYFELRDERAVEIAREVGESVSHWRSAARRCGLSESAMNRMQSAFDHDDLKMAVKLRAT